MIRDKTGSTFSRLCGLLTNPTVWEVTVQVLIQVPLSVTINNIPLFAPIRILPNNSVKPRQEVTPVPNTTMSVNALIWWWIIFSLFMAKELLLNLNANLRCSAQRVVSKLFIHMRWAAHLALSHWRKGGSDWLHSHYAGPGITWSDAVPLSISQLTPLPICEDSAQHFLHFDRTDFCKIGHNLFLCTE